MANHNFPWSAARPPKQKSKFSVRHLYPCPENVLSVSHSYADDWWEGIPERQNKKSLQLARNPAFQGLSLNKISTAIYTWSLTECQGWPFNLYGYREQISSTANWKDQISASANRLSSERWLVRSYVLATQANWNLSVNVNLQRKDASLRLKKTKDSKSVLKWTAQTPWIF